jgi:GDP-L-fucose synthase
MLSNSSLIYVAGHTGMVGSSIVRTLKKNNFKNILLASRKDLDLTNQNKTYSFLKKKKTKICIFGCSKSRWHSL